VISWEGEGAQGVTGGAFAPPPPPPPPLPSLYVKTGPGVDYDYMDDVFSCSTIIKMIRAYSVRPVDT
jgi:hypothetical protein